MAILRRCFECSEKLSKNEYTIFFNDKRRVFCCNKCLGKRYRGMIETQIERGNKGYITKNGVWIGN